MSDENEQIGNEGAIQGSISELLNRANDFGRIRDYNDPKLPAEIKEFMDAVIEPLEIDYTNEDLVIDFGSEPGKKLREIAERSIKFQTEVQGKMEILKSPLKETEGLTNDLKNFVVEFGSLAGAIAKGGTKAATSGLKKLTGLFQKWTKKEEQKEQSESEQLQDYYSKILPSFLSRIKSMEVNLGKLATDLQALGKNADEMTNANLRAVDAFGIYIGAGLELMKRYKTEILPQAKQNSADAQTSEERREYQDTTRNYMRLMERVRDMMLEYITCQQNLIAFDKAKEQIKEMQYTSKNQARNGIPLWYNTLNSAAMAVTLVKSADILDGNKKAGEEISSVSVGALKAASEMNRNLSLDGSIIGVNKTLENVAAVIKMLEDDKQASLTKIKTLESQMETLAQHSSKMLDAADESATAVNKTLDGEVSDNLSRRRAAQAEKSATNAQTAATGHKETFAKVAQKEAAPAVEPASTGDEMTDKLDAILQAGNKPAERPRRAR